MNYIKHLLLQLLINSTKEVSTKFGFAFAITFTFLRRSVALTSLINAQYLEETIFPDFVKYLEKIKRVKYSDAEKLTLLQQINEIAWDAVLLKTIKNFKYDFTYDNNFTQPTNFAETIEILRLINQGAANQYVPVPKPGTKIFARAFYYALLEEINAADTTETVLGVKQPTPMGDVIFEALYVTDLKLGNASTKALIA